MTGACAAVPAGSGFIAAITGFVDCQAESLASGAWQALAAPGSTLSIVLTGFLTIFIALIGYNLLLGRSMSVRDGTLAFVKIGAVFALATSWPAYRTLVYDLVIDGPGQLVAEIGPAARVVGSDGTLLQRLDLADQGFARLAVLGPGNAIVSDARLAPPPFAGFNAFALGGSRILFLLTAIASLASVRILTGLMLALGPFFIAFFLFDATRSLFEGWVRVLAGAALAMIGISISLGLELALIEPWLSTVLARRMAGEALPTMPVELFVVTTMFAIVALGVLAGSARVARAFRLPPVLRAFPVASETEFRAHQSAVGQSQARLDDGPAERSRAAAVANMMVALSRRELAGPGLAAVYVPSDSRVPVPGTAHHEGVRTTTPIGRSFTRRASSRVSGSANRRDGAA